MKTIVLLGALIGAAGLAGAASAATLDDVKASGLKCGVSTGLVGFAEEMNDRWEGFDVGICRAVAAAVLGNPDAVEFVPTTVVNRFDMLASGDIDILARSTTWTFARDVDRKFEFVGVTYYDERAFMIPASFEVTSLEELGSAKVCVQVDTTTQLDLADFFSTREIDYQPVPVTSNEDAKQKYLDGACDLYANALSALASTRAEFEDPSAHVILSETISKAPLGPVVRQSDPQWADVVRWTLNALIAAEELGITSANIDELAKGSENPEVNRLLGGEGDLGLMLGLEEDWAVRAIKAGGNYGELYARFLGESTPVGLARGLNAQWRDGGLLYSPPFR